MGAVYEAEHTIIQRKVAVKVLRPELCVNQELVRRFFNEAKATSTISHPNIIEVIDVGMLPEQVPFIVMELLHGEDLALRLARQKYLDVRLALNLMLQTASALQTAHAAGIVHRDLKPDNLFLVADPAEPGQERIKVLDFGIAKLRGTTSGRSVNTRAGVLLGTPQYMSPEQCRGIPSEIDERTDIYSLGVILYEALCGSPPFSSSGVGELMMQHMSIAPPLPTSFRSDLPPSVVQILNKALAKQPQARYQSMAELASALQQATAATSLHAALSHGDSSSNRTRSDDPVERGPTLVGLDKLPPLRSSRRGRIGATLGSAMGLSLLVWLSLRSGHSPPDPDPQQAAGTSSSESTETPPLIVDDVQTPEPPAHDVTRHSAVSVKQPSLEPKASPPPPPRPRPRPQPQPTPKEQPKLATPPTNASVAPPTPPVSAQPDSEEPGWLSLDSAPWSTVFLGGKKLGTTPLVRVQLPPGRHVLTLKNPELGDAAMYVVEIKPGATLSRFVGWGKQ